jgi:hypothetical protein
MGFLDQLRSSTRDPTRTRLSQNGPSHHVRRRTQASASESHLPSHACGPLLGRRLIRTAGAAAKQRAQGSDVDDSLRAGRSRLQASAPAPPGKVNYRWLAAAIPQRWWWVARPTGGYGRTRSTAAVLRLRRLRFRRGGPCSPTRPQAGAASNAVTWCRSRSAAGQPTRRSHRRTVSG